MSRRPSQTTLYVRPISDDCRRDDLRRAFSRYGKIIDVTVPIDYYSGRMKGFAFVEFDDVRDAEDALDSMNGAKFMGRIIDVQFTRGYRKTPAEMQQRDRSDRRRRHSRSRSPYRPRRRRSNSYSRSPSPDRRRQRSVSRSKTPTRAKNSRSRSYSR